METNNEISILLNEICSTFPEIHPLMDKWEPSATTDRMESFANATTLAFSRNGDPHRGEAYLLFISKRLSSATPQERRFIDSYYAEVLFWQSSEKAIKLGWPLVPPNIKELYLRFHGRPPGKNK